MVSNLINVRFRIMTYAVCCLLLLSPLVSLAEGAEKKDIMPENKNGSVSDNMNVVAAKNPSSLSGVIEKSFADNEQISVGLSNRDINRILVKADKIQSVDGPAGLYAAKNDVRGAVYISLYGDATFTIFISTVNGHNFSLLVTPKAVTGRTIILEPTSPLPLTAHWEAADSYQKILITLINGMVNNEVLEDYAYREVKKPKKTDFYRVANVKPLVLYSGSHLVGVVSEIRNKSKAPLVLKPTYFYKPGVRAVALSQQTLSPSETAFLYIVMSNI